MVGEVFYLLVGATPETVIEVAPKVVGTSPSWMPFVISAGVVVGLSLLFFVAWKYVRGTGFQPVITIGPEVLDLVKEFVPDKPGFDAHDVLNTVSHVAKCISGGLNNIENVEFDDVRDEVVAGVKQIIIDMGQTPPPDSVIEAESKAAFLLIKKYPELLEKLKKLQSKVPNA